MWSLALVALVVMATAGHTVSACSSGSGGKSLANNLPLYYGFFPSDNATQAGLQRLALRVLEAGLGLDEVRREYCQFTNHSLDTPIANLTSFAYTNPTLDLHVTSFYCNHGAQPGCAAYAASDDVTTSLGRSFGLNASALMLTPRTLGYRVELGADALPLWANGEGEAAPGLRAHFTVATAPGVPAVQTGLDLVELANRVGRPVNDSSGQLAELGAAALTFGQGRFLFLLSHRQPPTTPTIFRASDDGSGNGGISSMGAQPAAWLTLLGASAWRWLTNSERLAQEAL